MRAITARRRHDLMLIAGILAAALIGLVLMLVLRTPGTTAVVLIDGVETARYPLDTPAELTLRLGTEQTNHLVIRDGQAFITAADCPDRVCVERGGVSHVGETIVCLPHRLVIRIEGDGAGQPDIIV